MVEEECFERVDYTAVGLPIEVYDRCKFVNCNFQGTDVSHVNFLDCTFLDCDLSLIKLHASSFCDVTFRNCKLLGVQWNTCNQMMFTVHFEKCQLNYACFESMALKKTVFNSCELQEVDFTACNLSGADFNHSNLERAVFHRCNLEKADFRTASNFSIDPDANRLKMAHFSMQGLVGLVGKYGIKVD